MGELSLIGYLLSVLSVILAYRLSIISLGDRYSIVFGDPWGAIFENILRVRASEMTHIMKDASQITYTQLLFVTNLSHLMRKCLRILNILVF